SELGAGFTALPAAAAAVWLAFRVAGSVLVVPIAEELAFRGYLLRRLATAEVGGLSHRQRAALAIVGSSLLFGIMHSRLVAGTLAGMLFALAYRHRGELADAIVAHAAAN